MKEQATSLGVGFVDEKEVARYLGISVAQVRKWRTHGIGPTPHRFGRSVRYSVQEVEEFARDSKGWQFQRSERPNSYPNELQRTQPHS